MESSVGLLTFLSATLVTKFAPDTIDTVNMIRDPIFF